jgi:transposase
VTRQWKVIETVREKFTCRDCEAITQPPAPFHATPRGFIGPKLLATILFDKFGQHIPLNRQSQRFKCEGIDLSVSTLADQVGAGSFAAMPLYRQIEAHVLAAERLHGDDTTVPILAKGKTVTGRIWAYVRDDRPFGGTSPPAALYYASRDRRGERPAEHLKTFTGILQADAYSGFNALYDAARRPAPITPALCWAHSRRQFFELADIAKNVRRGKEAPDLLVEPLQHVGGLQVLVVLARQPEEGQRLLDGLLRPARHARILARPLGQPCGEIDLGLGEIAAVIKPAQLLQAIVAVLLGQMVERIPEEVDVGPVEEVPVG